MTTEVFGPLDEVLKGATMAMEEEIIGLGIILMYIVNPNIPLDFGGFPDHNGATVRVEVDGVQVFDVVVG